MLISINMSFSSLFLNLHFVAFLRSLIESLLYSRRISGTYAQTPDDEREHLS